MSAQPERHEFAYAHCTSDGDNGLVGICVCGLPREAEVHVPDLAKALRQSIARVQEPREAEVHGAPPAGAGIAEACGFDMQSTFERFLDER